MKVLFKLHCHTQFVKYSCMFSGHKMIKTKSSWLKFTTEATEASMPIGGIRFVFYDSSHL